MIVRYEFNSHDSLCNPDVDIDLEITKSLTACVTASVDSQIQSVKIMLPGKTDDRP